MHAERGLGAVGHGAQGLKFVGPERSDVDRGADVDVGDGSEIALSAWELATTLPSAANTRSWVRTWSGGTSRSGGPGESPWAASIVG